MLSAPAVTARRAHGRSRYEGSSPAPDPSPANGRVASYPQMAIRIQSPHAHLARVT